MKSDLKKEQEEYRRKIIEDYKKGLRSERFPSIDTEINFPPNFQKLELFDFEYYFGYSSKPKKQFFKMFNIKTGDFLQTRIYICKHEISQWFKYTIRPNLIFISDFSGLKIYNFDFVLFFEKKVVNSKMVYNFEIKDDFTKFTFWEVPIDHDECGILIENKNRKINPEHFMILNI